MFSRLEDKEVRRVSKRANLDPMIDEDSSDEEDYSLLPADVTKPSRNSQVEQTRPSRTPDVHSSTEGTEVALVPATKGHTTSVTTAPASVGSALRKNADGSVAVPKILPKRNKGMKVNKSILPYYWLTFASLLASKLEAKGKRADSPSA